MIRFLCSKCRQPLEVATQHAGQQARCSGCGQVTVVPAPPPARPSTTYQLTCPGCGEWLDLEDSGSGRLVRCPKCGRTALVPALLGAAAGAEPATPRAERERRLKLQGYLFVLAGGLLGVLFGTSIGVRSESGLVGALRALVGVVLGGGVGAIFVAMWAFRLGATSKMGGWLVPGAITGAVLGATLLAKDTTRPAALGGALLGALLGAGAGAAGAAVWRRLDSASAG